MRDRSPRDLTDDQREQRRVAVTEWIRQGFNATKAAEALRRDPATFYRWVSTLDLDAFRKNRGARVLFVDDQSYKKREVEDALLESGLVVDLADSGPAALDLASEGTYACVVTDQMMEGMDGLELCEILRSRTPALPIVILTAYPDFALCRHVMRENLASDVVPWSEFGRDPLAFGQKIADLAGGDLGR